MGVAIELGRRGHHVLVGTRDLDNATATVAAVSAVRGRATAVQLDIVNKASIEAASDFITGSFGELDVLVNNAAIMYDTWNTALTAELDEIRLALETNLFGTWQTTKALAPLLRSSGEGRIVNVSSEAGALQGMTTGRLPAYRVSKASLHALTRMWAAELTNDGVLVNAVCPGWTETEMGGLGGRPIEEAAIGIAWAATLPNDGPTGGFFRDGEALPW